MKASRVDAVWDAYLPGSPKATIRKKRGKGVHGRVFPSNTMPKNWKSFLCDDNNKTYLHFLLSIYRMRHRVFFQWKRKVNGVGKVTDAFFEMTNVQKSKMSILLLEHFAILMHDRTSACFGVNEARKKLFIHKSRSLENIPPTKAALEQHIKRAGLQAHCWSQTLVKNPRLPGPSNW